MTIEQQVFAQEAVDMPTFQADLAQRGLALVKEMVKRGFGSKLIPGFERMPPEAVLRDDLESDVPVRSFGQVRVHRLQLQHDAKPVRQPSALLS